MILSQVGNMKKHYILKLDSYEGEESSLTVNANGSDAMYVVLEC